MLLLAADHAELAIGVALVSLGVSLLALLLCLRRYRWSARQPGTDQRPIPAAGSSAPPAPAGQMPARAVATPKAQPGKQPRPEPAGEIVNAVLAEVQKQTRRRRAGVLLLLISLVVAAAVLEVALRLFASEALHINRDERIMMYHYDANLGWFPIPNSHQRSGAARAVSVTHNAEGFRDWEHLPSTKPKIAFLGDSFVWGYDVEASERFTDVIQASHPEWDVYNFGVSGYGTDQELLLLQSVFDEYKPKVVLLMFSTETDGFDNATNQRYGGYYKPYFVVETNGLRIHGVPVPHCENVFWSEHPSASKSYLVRLAVRAYYKLASPPIVTNRDPTGALIREMQTFVHGKGAELLIGLTRGQGSFEEYLRRLKIPFVDLSTPLRYPQFGQHWTPAGHNFVAKRIEGFIQEGKFLDQ